MAGEKKSKKNVENTSSEFSTVRALLARWSERHDDEKALKALFTHVGEFRDNCEKESYADMGRLSGRVALVLECVINGKIKDRAQVIRIIPDMIDLLDNTFQQMSGEGKGGIENIDLYLDFINDLLPKDCVVSNKVEPKGPAEAPEKKEPQVNPTAAVAAPDNTDQSLGKDISVKKDSEKNNSGQENKRRKEEKMREKERMDELDELEENAFEDEDAQKDKYLTFRIGEEDYAIEIKYVMDINRMQKITEVPDTDDFVKGVINLRGKIIPVIDIRLRFKMSSRDYDDRTCIIVVNMNSILTGLIVDRVNEVLNIPANQIDPAPRTGRRIEHRYVSGLGKVGDKVKIILDINRLLSDEDMDALKEMASKEV